MASTCSGCGAGQRDGARFCDACGAAIVATEERAEFKQVTVLFADVVQSMNLAAVLGPERLRDIMAELFTVSTKVVQRYGGTVDKFTGDGIMALFGAPIALEDHAVRGCLAALGLQREVRRIAVEFNCGVDVSVRVGLNSGQVVAGRLGSGSPAYTAIGAQVGMAQRMESVAPPGGVMISESTARLVEDVVDLSEPESLYVKGMPDPVPARRLLQVKSHHALSRRADSPLVGRRWEMAILQGIFDGVVSGRGGVSVGVCGPAGMGKSRIVRELAAIAATQGVPVFRATAESHGRELPFQVVAQVLRAVLKVGDADSGPDWARLQARLPGASSEDLLLLGDLLGINEPAAEVAGLHPDARRRRLTGLITSAWTAQRSPALFVVENAQWIDEVSESMLAEFLSVITRTRSMVLITYRSDYRGVLSRLPDGQTIYLASLGNSEIAQLLAEQLGTDDSVRELATAIGDRAVGNPFFVEEIVRDLAERGVLSGRRGAYTFASTVTEVTDVTVPPTLYAVIAARIDRLGKEAKRTLGAAAVVGARFTADLLAALGVDPIFDALVDAELVDQVKSSSPEEYVFRQPLIRTVAYESQLTAHRAEIHRRVAAAIEKRDQGLVDENAALIAEHLEAAGDFGAAHGWHMRAGAWSRNRDIAAARRSWARARQVALALPVEDPSRLAMLIAAGTLLCATAYRTAASMSDSGFQEMRDMCAQVGDKRSLALAMIGHMTDHMVHGGVTTASKLGTEALALLDAVDDPALTVGLSAAPMIAKQETGEIAEMLRRSQLAIELAAGDPVKGDIVFGSPLALALVFRGVARCWLGKPGWREDFDDGLAMARHVDALTYSKSVVYKYSGAILQGVLLPDETTLCEVEQALDIATATGDDHHAVGLAMYCLGGVLLERGSAADRARGRALLAEIREMCGRGRFYRSELPVLDLFDAREMARDGDLDGAVDAMRVATDCVFERGQFAHGSTAVTFLVQTLLQRGGAGDVQEADAAIARLTTVGLDDLVVVDAAVLRMRALLARARGDDAAFGHLVDRYHDLSATLGFEGHLAMADALR